MESAYDNVGDEIVDAAQLRFLDVVDKDRYVCPGCGVKVFPAAYRPGHWVRPYFRVQEGGHLRGCDVDGEQVLIGRGRVERLSSPSGKFPATYPSVLRLIEERPIVSAAVLPPRSVGSSIVKHDESSGGGMLTRSQGVANTIRPICRAYINFPFDRDLLALHIPSIDSNTYNWVFRRLKSNGLGDYQDTRVFYASIRWSPPIETPDWLEVTLDAGERDQKGKLLRGYRVRIEWEAWSEFKRNRIRQEIEVSRREAIAVKKTDPDIKAYLFFIPEKQRDPQDTTLFRVTDHRLICCIVDSITYPSAAASVGPSELGETSPPGTANIQDDPNPNDVGQSVGPARSAWEALSRLRQQAVANWLAYKKRKGIK